MKTFKDFLEEANAKKEKEKEYTVHVKEPGIGERHFTVLKSNHPEIKKGDSDLSGDDISALQHPMPGTRRTNFHFHD